MKGRSSTLLLLQPVKIVEGTLFREITYLNVDIRCKLAPTKTQLIDKQKFTQWHKHCNSCVID